jgi:hypothetical protein
MQAARIDTVNVGTQIRNLKELCATLTKITKQGHTFYGAIRRWRGIEEIET